MDTTQDIIYRSYYLNDSSIQDNIVQGAGAGAGITGSVVDAANFSDVQIVQHREKKARQDGMDAGSVYFGGRTITLRGTIYGLTRALLFDEIWDLRAALNPVLAQGDDPADFGFRPLYFSTPTNDVANYASGAKDLKINAICDRLNIEVVRDRIGGDDSRGLAVTWEARFWARDPGIFGASPVDVGLTGASPITGNWVNRGGFYSPVNIAIEVDSAAGTFVFTMAGAVNTITIPSSTGNRIYRYNGEKKILTVEEASVETPAMNLLTFGTTTTHPLIPSGTSAYTVTYSGVTMQAGSHMWIDEQHA